MEFHYRLFSESSWAQCNDVKHRYSFDNRWVTHRGEACWESHCLLLNSLKYSLYMNICTAENRLPLYCELQLLLFVRRPCTQVITELHFPGRSYVYNSEKIFRIQNNFCRFCYRLSLTIIFMFLVRFYFFNVNCVYSYALTMKIYGARNLTLFKRRNVHLVFLFLFKALILIPLQSW